MNVRRSNKSVVWAVALLLLSAFGIVAAVNFRKGEAMADYSAHATLTVEICDRLAAVPHGQRYPESLSQLRLTYPDGGDASLLNRFIYHSTGTNCTVRTVLRGEEFVRSYP